jgi:hypothetical protein
MLVHSTSEASQARRLPVTADCSEAEKLEAAEEEGRNNDVWAGMDIDNPELQAGLKRAGGWVSVCMACPWTCKGKPLGRMQLLLIRSTDAHELLTPDHLQESWLA